MVALSSLEHWSSGHAAEFYPAEPRFSNQKTSLNVIFQNFNLLIVLMAVKEGETPETTGSVYRELVIREKRDGAIKSPSP